MLKLRSLLAWSKASWAGRKRPYSVLIMVALVLVCGALILISAQANAQNDEYTPAIPADEDVPRVMDRGSAVSVFSVKSPKEPKIIQSITRMGASPGAAIVPTFEDINPDFSTLDPTSPNGASGGRCNGLASVAGDNQTFYVASEWGGLFKTKDGGLTWDFLPGHTPMVTWDVEVDPGNTDTVYATSFYDGRLASISGIQVSNDAGVTWAHPTTAQPNDPADEGTGADNTPQAGYNCDEFRRTEPSAFGIAIRPDAPANVIIGTNCGVARSTDSGATWEFRDPDPSDPASNVWDVVYQPAMTGFPQGIIDICGDEGHFRSTDGGVTWTASAGALPLGRCSIAASPDEHYVLFVAASDNDLYESDDAGANWSNLGNPDSQGRIPFVATNQRSDDPGPTDRFDVWFGDVKLFRADCTSQTAQGGTNRCPASGSWTNTQTEAHWDSGDVVFDTQAANDACPMLYTNDGGVYYNTVTTSPACHDPVWEQPNITPHALWLFAMDGVDQPGDEVEDLYFGCQDTGSFSTLNAGAALPTWDNHECCDSFDFVADANRVIWTVCCGFSLVRSGRGLTGDVTINGPPGPGRPAFRFPDYIDQFGDNLYVAVTGSGAYVTDDITASPVVWTQLGAGSTPAGGFCAVKTSVVSDGTPTFYAQTFCPGGSNSIFENPGSGQLWKYEDKDPGGAWERLDDNDGLTPNGIAIFAVDPNNPDRLYASYFSPTGPQMIFSNDGGQTWENDTELDNLMTGGGFFKYRTQRGITPGPQFNGYAQPSLIAFDQEDPDIIVAGGRNSGVFISRNGGARWQLLTDPFDSANSGIPHLPRPWFAYFDHEPADSGEVKIYIGTVGRGVWRITLPIDVPVISVPGSVTFDDTCVGDTSFETLNVCNTGGGDVNLIVDEITSTDSQFSVTTPSSGFPIEISPDFCFPFEAVFSPSSEGSHSAILSITSNDPVDPILEVQATGTGTTPELVTIMADGGDFGDVCPGEFKDLMLTLSNSGGCDLTVIDISSDSAEFVVAGIGSLPLVIGPGGSVDVPIRFGPTSRGAKSGTITVTSDDPNSPSTVTVSGNGIEPDIATSIADGGEFGDVCIGEFKDLDLTITNSGGCVLNVSSITSDSAEFQVAGVVSPPLVIGPGASVAVPIRFEPTSFGPKNATITITSDDPDDGTVTVAVSGNVPPGDIRVTGSTDFGDVCAEEQAEKNVSVCNVGPCNLNVSSVSIDCTDFTLINNPFPAPVSPDSCLDLVIRFTPTSAGPKTCTLTINSDDPDTPTVELTLTANTPLASIDVPPDQGFPSTVIQSVDACSSNEPFPVSNTGTCNLTITDLSISDNPDEFSLSGLPSFPIILEPGHIAGEGALNTVFAPDTLGRTRTGQISVTYVSDPITGATLTEIRDLCGEGVRTGARVLVTNNGVPLPKVKMIKLQRMGGNRNKKILDTIDNARNLTLQTVTPTHPCGPFDYHREYGTVSNPIQLAPGTYQVTAAVRINGKVKKKTVGFDVTSCGFNPTIVIDF